MKNQLHFRNVLSERFIKPAFIIFFFIFVGSFTAEESGYMVTENSSLVQNINLPAGSIIIDMGIVPQTINNGIKPYGLVHLLLKNHNTPVLWSINPNKSKDGVDFTVDGRSFKGGPFVVSQEFLTTDVLNLIDVWNNKGVVTYTTQSIVEIPVYRQLDFRLKWVINDINSSIVIDYLENAEIPQEDFVVMGPTSLTSCEDLFLIPHADPDWAGFGNPLLNWNKSIANGGNSGWIWAGCQSGSNLEGDFDPSDSSIRTNFLAENPSTYPGPFNGYGLIDHDDHENASGNTPYLNAFPTDPFMQFMGRSDNAHDGGSEQIYLPYPTGNWRSTTKVGVWDPNQTNLLNGDSPGEAAIIVYGRAFGDPDRGQVLYEGGHRFDNGTEAENVAAQRVFFNFAFEAHTTKQPLIVDNGNTPNPIVLQEGQSFNFDVSATTGSGGTISYSWSTNCSVGSFDNTSIPNPVFTVNGIITTEECTITVSVEDSCGRISFKTFPVRFEFVPPPPTPRDCNCAPIYKDSNFENPALISGSDLNVGAVYRFTNVFPTNPYGITLDALVRIEEFSGGAGLLEIDVTSSGLNEAFQPRINSSNNNDQSVLFSITFV